MRIEIEIDTTRSRNDNVVTRMTVKSQGSTNTTFEGKHIIDQLERIFKMLKADTIKNQEWCDQVYKERQSVKEEIQPEIIKMCRNCKFQTAPCAFFLKRICSNPIDSGNHPEMNAGVMWEIAEDLPF